MRRRKFNLSPLHGLILEIMRQCGGGVDERNLIELAQDFVGHFGSPDIPLLLLADMLLVIRHFGDIARS